MQSSESMNKYFESIDCEIKRAYDVANKARSKGYDPDNFVDLPLAKNMAERVEGLISVVTPQIKNKGMIEKILNLELEYGIQNPIIAFLLAEAVAKEEFCEFKDKREAMEVGLRTGLAYLTNGVVASPLEGFIRLELKNRIDGNGKFFSLYFGGPIRSAGTTATCYFVACCDYVRRKMGYQSYDPTFYEIKRSYAEMDFFHSRITNLQYMPSEQEVEFITQNLPVQIEGDGSERLETPNYKDLPRIRTNRLRNGFCLVMGESLASKFKKFWGKFSIFYEKVGMSDWIFVEQFIKLESSVRSKSKEEDVKRGDSRIFPDYGYMKDLVAGRPVLGYPVKSGAFRLRYGRTRVSGFSVDALHPATLVVLDGYISTGTQIKPERPGKGATISVCDKIEGPRVKLKNGDVVFVETEELARKLNKNIDEILYVGDILISYGDFLDRGHVLVPPGYCEEWWSAELEKKGKTIDPFVVLNFEEGYRLSKENDIPLYPRFTYFWKEINYNDLISLIEWIRIGSISEDKIILPLEGDLLLKKIIEILGIPHKCVGREYIVIEGEWFNGLMVSLGFYSKLFNYDLLIEKYNKFNDVLDFINSVSELRVRDKSGIFIGARMARPEKGKMRELAGSPHCLFPIGKEGGRLSSFQSALDKGTIRAQFSLFYCNICGKIIYSDYCNFCGSFAVRKWKCNQCGLLDLQCEKGGHRCDCYDTFDLNIRGEYANSLKRLGLGSGPELVKGVRGTSNKGHIPESLEKGILRAVHHITVNKDGTTRYDMTEMAMTHFKPKEVVVSIEKLKSLGYLKDFYGNDLVSIEQIMELKCQDIILPACLDSPDEGADFVLTRVANFLDDLLVKFYGVEPYYNIKTREDLVGQLVIGLSPHTCAGIVARIIGFSKQQGLWAHPYLHSAMRRDCLYPTTKFLVNDQYLEIGNYVEDLILRGANSKIIDLVGTKRIECSSNLFTYGLNTKTNKIIKKKIKYFIKGPSETKWIKIITVTNKELIMTENHKFLYFNDCFRIKIASEIKVEDKIPILKYEGNIVLEKIGDCYLDIIKKVEEIEDKKHSYCLEVEGNELIEKNIILGDNIINMRCDGDEAGVMLLMDALLNFSRKLLSDHRGATQDEPLILASLLLPKEVDDMVFNLDTVFKYPLEFYEAAEQYKYATEIKLETVRDRLDKKSQYEGFGFTHDTQDINAGITCSVYKTIPSMKEKVEGQMNVAKKLRCVNQDDVARLIIERHFIRDIKGNLRKFSMQQFRCVDCNEKYRRPPLKGDCNCGGRLLFTISEGSVIKYLEPSLSLAREYNLPAFLKQSLDLLQQSVDMVFGKEKEKQEGLGKFF